MGAWLIGAQARWQSASTREVAWREGVEASRGILRLCLRAWRELTRTAFELGQQLALGAAVGAITHWQWGVRTCMQTDVWRADEATQESDLRIEIYMHVWRGDRANLLSHVAVR